MSAKVMGWVDGAGRVDAPIGTLVRLGATPDNDVVVRVEGVSRTHARIVGEQDGYWVEDANSKNGTWLNGERVKRARLKHLDVITLGRFAELVFVEREGVSTPAPTTSSGVRVRIEWLDGSRRGDVIDIPTGETLIGRAESCAIVVDTPAVSRAHARISNSGGRIAIEDLGSANGTTVNGQLIKGPTPLATGAEVVLGDARRFRVMIDGAVPAAAAPTQLGAVSSRSQDMEWATRLVFSAEDLEAISRAAGGIDQPSPPPMRPVGKAPQAPVVPVPSPAVPPANVQSTIVTAKPAAPPAAPAAPPPAPPREAPVDDGTRLGGADLRLPTAIGAQPAPPTTPEAGATQLGGFGPAAPPPFKPPKFTPGAPSADSEAIPERTMFDRGAVPAPGNNLPPAVRPAAAQAARRIVSAQITGPAGTFPLAQGTSTIGRSPDATVRIESRELSRIHAAITVTPRDVVVEDRGSVNGTTVNGTKVAGPTPVAAGDRVAFANVEFRLDVTWTEGK